MSLSSIALLALLVITLSPLVEAAGSKPTVVLSQIVHRHGSRSPLAPHNHSKICPDSCGVLNSNGTDMLLMLGKAIRQHYKEESGSSSSNVLPTEYNYQQVFTRSTYIPRTMQSADAFLRGLFPSTTESSNNGHGKNGKSTRVQEQGDGLYPVVYTTPLIDDQLLLIDSMPAFTLPFMANVNSYHDTLWSDFVTHTFTNSTIAAMAQEAYLDQYCAESPVACLLVIQDIAEAWNSDGTLASGAAPTIQKNIKPLRELLIEFNKMVYSYNKTNSDKKEAGSPGQPLAQAMLSNMESILQKKKEDKIYFYEYSAHDSTVIPFAVTLGEEGQYRPPFGQFYLIELLREDDNNKNNNKDDNNYSVRGFQGYPKQEPGDWGSHTTELQPMTLSGMKTDGTSYNSSTTPIPYHDFKRFIDSSRPQSTKGICYVSKDVARTLKCNNPSPPPTNSPCAKYRTICPDAGCPDGFYLSNVTTGNCEPDGPGISIGGATALGVCTAFGGILVGAGLMFALSIIKKKKQHKYSKV